MKDFDYQALDHYLSEEEFLESNSLIGISRNLSILAEKQKVLDEELRKGIEKDRQFWEECRGRSVTLNKK